MAESRTNSEGQGSSLCGLQMTCSSDIPSNLKKHLNHSIHNTMLDDSLLHLDNTELKCSSASYKHTNDNGYSDSNEPMDMSVSGKCSDSNQASVSHKVDKELFSGKESSAMLSSQPLTNNSLAKPTLSSKFMISSLLSTKAVSSVTTILTQARSCQQSQQSKVTKSTSNCDSVPNTTPESSTKLFETKQTTRSLETDSQSELSNSVVSNSLNHPKGDSLNNNTGQLQLGPGARVHTELAAETQNNEERVRIVSAVRYEDVEDMQVEETNSLTVKDPVLHTDAVSPGAVNESDMKIKKMVDGKSISSLKSDLCNKADVSDENNVLDESDEIQAQSSTDDDVLLIDEHYDSDSIMESNKVDDTSAWKIGSANSSAMHESTDLDPELVNNSKDMKSTQGSESVDICSSKNALSDHQTVLDYSVKSHKSNNDDNSVVDISDSEDAQIQRQVKLGNKSDKDKGVKLQTQDGAAAAVKDQSFTERDARPCTGAETEAHTHSSLAGTSVTSLDDDVRLAVHAELPEVSELNMSAECAENDVTCESTSRLKVSTHSANMNASLVNSPETSNSNEEKQMQLGVSLDKKVSADRMPDKEADFHETNSVIVGNPPMDRRESLNDQDKTEDDIPLTDTGDDNKPANSSTEKYTFKNILFMPKDKTTSQKNTAADKESESLASTETVATGKSVTTVSTVGETSITQITASDTTEKQSHQNESHVKAHSPEQVNNDTGNERKRLQTETLSSASKRSKLDSVISNDKVVNDGTSKTDKVVIAEKNIPSTEVKSAVKPKDDKAVLLSNEVLQSLISLRVKAFIKNQKQANLDRLNLRTRGMQSASNLWKETAKHLERSVLELTALNQKLESRKAHLVAVKTQPTSSPTPVQRTPPVVTQPFVHRTGRPGRPPLYPRPAPNIPPPAPQPPVIRPPAPPQEKMPPSSKPVETPVPTNNVNLIDLTDDEETSKNVITKTPKTVSSQTPNHITNKPYTGVKTGVPSPGNGYVRQSPQAPGTSGNLLGSQIMQSSVSGSQHLTTSNIADTQPHLVTPNNSATQHSGTANQPTFRPGAATSTYGSSGQANTPTNPRNMAPNPTPPAVTSPTASGAPKTAALSLPPSFLISNKHPAPLPSNMDTGNAPPTAKKRPPKPSLKISRVSQGIVLSWNMPSLFDVEKIASYQLYAYQESDSATPRSSLWKKVGEVTALPLPMACTLTQFQEGNKYHFAVRAVDQYGRCGSYSDPSSIYLGPKS
ncbi:hypothetical protein BsWGS_20743 [Bradybaena similaris]